MCYYGDRKSGKANKPAFISKHSSFALILRKLGWSSNVETKMFSNVPNFINELWLSFTAQGTELTVVYTLNYAEAASILVCGCVTTAE